MSSALVVISDIGMGAGGFAAAVSLLAAFFRKRIGVWTTGKMSAFVQPLVEDLRTDISRLFDEHTTELKQAKELIHAVDTKVVKATAAVYPNGGSSLADRTQRIEVTLAELARDVKHLQEAK